MHTSTGGRCTRCMCTSLGPDWTSSYLESSEGFPHSSSYETLKEQEKVVKCPLKLFKGMGLPIRAKTQAKIDP